ncbi:MAG: hypothetical protein RR907_14620, partial [Comamonas sp.]
QIALCVERLDIGVDGHGHGANSFVRSKRRRHSDLRPLRVGGGGSPIQHPSLQSYGFAAVARWSQGFFPC